MKATPNEVHVLYIGLEAATKEGLRDALVSAFLKRIATLFGGYSASVVTGGWISDSDQLVEEAALRVEIVTDKAVEVEFMAKVAKAHFHQECVMYTRHLAKVAFV